MQNRFGMGVAALILSGALLAATNPSEEKHRDALLDRVEDSGGKAGRYTLQGLEGLSCFLGNCFDYRNHLLFSTMYADKTRLSIGFLGMVF